LFRKFTLDCFLLKMLQNLLISLLFQKTILPLVQRVLLNSFLLNMLQNLLTFLLYQKTLLPLVQRVFILDCFLLNMLQNLLTFLLYQKTLLPLVQKGYSWLLPLKDASEPLDFFTVSENYPTSCSESFT
jgi:hypothetical protein